MHYEKFPDGTVKCIEDEIPFELPEGWEWTRLQAICEPITDGTHKTPTYSDEGFIFLSSKNVTSGHIDWDNIMYIPESLHNELYARLAPQKNDILLAKNGTTGVAAIVDRDCIFDIYVSLALLRIIGYIISPEYLLSTIASSTIQNYFNSSLKGIGVPNLHLEHIRTTLIPVAPINEQYRIATKLEQLLSFADNIESDKTDLQTTIQLTKSKILDLAIRGKLVPQNPDDEPANVLLDRIRAEKEGLIKQGKIKRDKKESVIFKGDDNSYYEKIGDTITCIDEELPFELPDGWAWIRLQTCCQKEIKRGKSPKYAESSDTLVFAQKCNTKYDGINMELALYLDESTIVKYPNDEYMQDKDTVINSTGTGTLGRVGIYRKTDNRRGKPVVPDSHVTVIRANNEISAEYLYFFLKAYQQELEKLGEGSTNQKELKPLTLKNLIVALPPYAEQERIIEIITAAVEIMTNIEKSLS